MVAPDSGSQRRCPACQYSPIPAQAESCPSCGQPLPDPAALTQFHVEQTVEQVDGGEVTGVKIGTVAGNVAVGYTAAEVETLLARIRTEFSIRPFDGRSPYVGLEPFQEEDAGRFFGRERLVGELLVRIQSARFIMVAGPSGSGKSSLIRAGLLPALKSGKIPNSEGWRYMTLRPGREPLQSLGRAIAGLVGSLNAGEDIRTKGLVDATILHQWCEIALGDRTSQRCILFIDQFEEIFTQVAASGAGEREAFINLLTTAASAEDGRTIVIVTLRSDFVSNCAAYPDLNRLLNQQFLQVGAMAPDELVSAIARPALQVDLPVDPALVAQIISDMRDEPGALPLMQFALKRQFEHRQANGGVMALTLDDYLALGGLQKALEQYADTAFHQLSTVEQDLAKVIFSGLVQPGRGTQDTRRTAFFRELTPAGVVSSELEGVIYKLANARLLITDEKDDTPGDDRTATLAHERLLEAWPWLKRLVDENRETIALQSQINEDATRWERSGRDDSYLYTGARLVTAQEQLQSGRLPLSQLAKEFIEAAVALQEAGLRLQRRRVRQTIAGLGLAAVVFAALALIASIFQVEATHQSQTATYALGEAHVRGTAVFHQAATAQSAQSTSAANAALAEQRATIALSRQLASQSLAELIAGRTDLSLLLAIEAYRTMDTPQARSALLSALQSEPRLAHILTGHNDYVLDVAFDPSGSRLASGGCAQRDRSREKCLVGEVRLWELDTGQLDLPPLRQHGDKVTRVAFSPDGRWLASGDEKGTVLTWDARTGQLAGLPLQAHEQRIGLLAFSPDSQWLFSGSPDQPLVQWDISTQMKTLAIIDAFSAVANGARFLGIQLPSGILIDRSAGEDGRVELWDTQSWQRIGHADGIGIPARASVVLSPNGRLLAAVDGKEVVMWDVDSGQPFHTPLTGPLARLTSVLFSPDGLSFAAGGEDRSIYSWTGIGQAGLQGSAPPASIPLTGHIDWISSLAASPDGRWLASGSRDASIRIWDWLGAPTLAQTVLHHPELVLGMQLDPNRKWIAFGSCAARAANGEDCTEGEIVLLDSNSGKITGPPLRGHTNLVNVLAFSPRSDPPLLASGSWDGHIILWDLDRREPVFPPLEGHTDFVTGLAFSQDGQTLLSTGRDQTLRRWDVRTGQQLGEPLPAHTENVTSLAYSPTASLAATGSVDQNILLWDLTTNSPVSQSLPTLHTGQITALQFSPDGRLLASAGADGAIIFWDMNTRQARATLAAHQGRVSGISFSVDGLLFASGGVDGKVILWDAATGLMIGQPLSGHTDTVSSLAFSPDGQRLFSSGRDQQILSWDLNPEDWAARACQVASRSLTEKEWVVFVGSQVPYRPACSFAH